MINAEFEKTDSVSNFILNCLDFTTGEFESFNSGFL